MPTPERISLFSVLIYCYKKFPNCMHVFIRKAGFWNARTWKITSQFGHIMLCMKEQFYSFNRSAFLENQNGGCVQIITKKTFCRTYEHQIWHMVEIEATKHDEQQAIDYFVETAQKHTYSSKNNCTLECQRALESIGIRFPGDSIFPGSILAHFTKPLSNSRVRSIKKVRISTNEGFDVLSCRDMYENP